MIETMKYSHLVLIIAVATSISFSHDVAAKKRFRLGGGIKGATSKTYDANTLSVQDLVTCINTQNALDKSEHNIVKLKVPLDALTSTIEGYDKQLKELSDLISKTDTSVLVTEQKINQYNEQIDNYNQLLETRNGVFDEYSTSHEGFNKKVDKHNRLNESFSTYCAGKRYYEDDMATAQSQMVIQN
jgi:peptidoglycan hydrolase CwlO-like protein|tara:strand:+ start:39145 stop:39702 length:558 start_codon:yes stop_codon:yes gene_type:complete